jgi:hypothetical protein
VFHGADGGLLLALPRMLEMALDADDVTDIVGIGCTVMLFG